MLTFVLVPGSWHDGSCWRQVVEHLESLGHKAYAPTVAGHGKNVDKNVNHQQCTQSIVDYIVNNQLTDIVLLGHSYGGTIISKVAEAIPERIKRLVYHNAFVVQDGNSLLDEVPPHYKELFSELAKSSNENTVTLPYPVWREAFMNDADESLARDIYDNDLSSEPFQPFMDKLDMKKFYSLSIPKSYINGTEDIALPQGEWGWHPRMSNRLGLFRLVQMRGGHETMYTNPIKLAEAIVEAGRD